MELNDQLVFLAHITDGISTSLNRYGAEHGLAPLGWRFSDVPEVALEATHPEGRAHPDAELICKQWADELGFAEYIDTSGEGFRSWQTTIGGLQVEIHCITDATRYSAIYPDDTI
jgi:hypothetical protein